MADLTSTPAVRGRRAGRVRRLTASIAVPVLLLTACSGVDDGPGTTVTASPQESAPTGEDEDQGTASSSATADEGPVRPTVTRAAATGLEAPWGLDFLPSGRAVVTERDRRRVLVLDGDGGVREVGVLEQAAPQGEGGLLGVAVSPDFVTDRLLYFYLTTPQDNRIVRAALRGGSLGATEVVLDGIPAGFIHDGGRLAFGPDGFLYASTGEAGERSLSQDRRSLAGKILRITPDGDPAPDNPFGTPVWSWGHRNVQGLAFDDSNRLWASEFGDDTWDELNRIRAGGNYGWPEVEGRGGGEEMVNPQVVWRTSEASPSGLAHLDGNLWMAALRGNRLWQVPVLADGRAGNPRDWFVGEYGRLRTVVPAPDGTLWLTTSNRDGRGDPGERDDQVLVVETRP
jgi:glucose/arabinose dehydrogenase